MRRHRRDLFELVRPLVDHPVVPVEREAVHRDRVQIIERALGREAADELGVDRRNAAEHARQARRFGGDRLAGEPRHAREARPAGIGFEVPVRLVVRLVPDHRRFDQRVSPLRAG